MFCNQCGATNVDGSRFCSDCGGPITSSTPGKKPAAAASAAETEIGLPIGTILENRYRILGILGMGGMGRVYLAEDQKLETRVAIKVLREVLSRDPGSVKRLIAEARHSMTLSHPNVVRVHNFEDGEMVKFLVMEYVEGGTLAGRIADRGKLPEEESRRIAIEACKGLEHAHEQKVIHRDIKPGNILLGKTGAVKIADFGIARECRDSVSRLTSQIDSGTLLYMSPEQLIGKSNEASDLYSLGVVLYEMLIGQPPFRSGDITYQIREVPSGPPEGISPALSAIVLKCLEKKPERRFASVRALREELDGTAAAKHKEEERHAAELRRAEEERLRDEEQHTAEEARRRAEEQRKEEERLRLAELEAKRPREEERRRQEEARRREEESKRAAAGLVAAGLTLIERGEYGQAEAKLQEALSLDPPNAEAKAALARCRDEKAAAEERSKHAQDQNVIPAVANPNYGRWIVIGLLLVAWIVVVFWLIGTHNGGENTPSPQQPVTQDEVARQKNQIRNYLDAHNWDAAGQSINELLKIAPNDPDAAAWQNQISAGVEADRKAAEISALKKQARDSMNGRDWKSAEEKLANILKLAPNDPDALALRKQVDREIETERAAAEVKPAPNSIGIEFVAIPAGKFMMGCSPGDSQCRIDEIPRHEVTISRGFELGKYEVTQAQWVKVMGNNPSNFKGNDRLPVDQVSPDDAQAFIAKLNALNDGHRHRLPTEAEWEYAARGGAAGPYYGNLDEIAWYDSNSGSKPHPVGQKQPNGYGLYDMLGNVEEWCSDWYGESSYGGSPAADPKGPSTGQYRVARGGSWVYDSTSARVSSRYWGGPVLFRHGNGFRVCREKL